MNMLGKLEHAGRRIRVSETMPENEGANGLAMGKNEERGEDEDEEQEHVKGHCAVTMSRTVAHAAAAAVSSRRNDRYTDDPNEAVRLLDSASDDHDQDPAPASAKSSKNQPKSLQKSKGLSRTIPFHPPSSLQSKFPPNIVRNQKYSVWSFFPVVLYEQFRFFFNLYFLLVALSQFIPSLKIGFIATYIAPLAFVLSITIGKEAYDDYKRNLRDREANGQKYLVVDYDSHQTLLPSHLSTRALPASSLLVGHLVRLQKNDRVPADIVLLWTSDPSGTCFVRTDQLDGETDWKMRVSVAETQAMGETGIATLGASGSEAEIYADAPTKDIHTFIGTFTLNRRTTVVGSDSDTHVIGDDDDEEEDEEEELSQSAPMLSHQPSHNSLTDLPMTTRAIKSTVLPLTAENVLWANTVLASSASIIGFVIYTGPETRAVMNTSKAGTKVGLLEVEVNGLAKILCTTTFILSVVLVALNGFRGGVFSTHTVVYIFSHQIMTDETIPGTIVRTSTLPEELGRMEYLLSDKTGTLTRNEMEMRKLHMGTMSYGQDSMDEVGHQLALAFASAPSGSSDPDAHSHHTRHPSSMAGTGIGHSYGNPGQGMTRGRRDMSSRVTPVTNDDGSVTYQASSPDEVAIVTWTESIGLGLVYRDRTKIMLRAGPPQSPSKVGTHENLLAYDILSLFPFTSESKRMGIIVRDVGTGEITFLQKGADVVMARIVQRNDWLEEESGNMAREGLRTLVVARKRLSPASYAAFEQAHHVASTSTDPSMSRADAQAQVVADHLEHDMELLGLTGVEDRLQDEVRSTLELMRNAGVKVWMLTGDKVETARCIAISTKMVGRGQYIHEVAKVKNADDMKDHLDFLQNKLDCCLVIDGESLQLCLNLFKNEFIEIAAKLSAVVACRCSPTQKADIARLIRAHTGKRVCCIGDGGNDVSMIQAADVGVGIVGKEGRQASLAADFSLTQFSFLSTLLLWHGRNSYRRSATLAQFVIHRGLIISIMQAVFSAIFYFAPIALYQGWLMVGYATAYTMMPVFSLVLDRDVSRETALVYPELYKELVKGRVLSYKSFFEWVMVSVYQGAAIMIMSLVLFENEFLHIVSISFTALVLNELIMVALEITTWHAYMIISEVATLFLYIISIAFLPEYFDLSFVVTLGFAWKVAVIVGISAMPLWIVKLVKSRVAPAASSKLLYTLSDSSHILKLTNGLAELVWTVLTAHPSLRSPLLSSFGSRIHASAVRVLYSSLVIPDDCHIFDKHFHKSSIYPLIVNASRYARKVKALTVVNPILTETDGSRRLEVPRPLAAEQLSLLLQNCSNLESFCWTSSLCPPDGLFERLLTKWDAPSLPLLSSLPITTLYLSALSQAGKRALVRMLLDLGQDAVLDDVTIDLMWFDESLCEAISFAGRKIRRLCISTCGTKLNDGGLISILESCDALEELNLDEVEGPHHSWAADHLDSLHAFPVKYLSEICISTREGAPVVEGSTVIHEHSIESIASPKQLPSIMLERFQECKVLKSLHCDFWTMSISDIKAVLESCPSLESLKASLDAPFSSLLGLTTTLGSLLNLRTISVTIDPVHFSPTLSNLSSSGSVPTRAKALSIQSLAESQTCPGKGFNDPSLPPLRDVKRFIRKFPKLTLLQWYGKYGRGAWTVKRPTSGSKLSINVSVDYLSPSLTPELSKEIAREHQIRDFFDRGRFWLEEARPGQSWTNDQAESLAGPQKSRLPSISTSTSSISDANTPLTPSEMFISPVDVYSPSASPKQSPVVSEFTYSDLTETHKRTPSKPNKSNRNID
ncbi:hypothetical protein D9757_004373 [Collybiopsis confluens]|uniref:Phospholipid-transporting ATPase n=1 Tax=Collybiopsis confluens TaxID=2823264 RepID=A0A8H5HU75_9AGAR|nr:hypothetical protein D9757_004373 [Collybiopsis confluens]